jgi:hypothetical protein
LQAAWVPGVSLLVDFPFAAYPDNSVHWAEVLLPIYNFVQQQDWAHGALGPSPHIDTLVMTNLRKEQLAVSPLYDTDAAHHQLHAAAALGLGHPWAWPYMITLVMTSLRKRSLPVSHACCAPWRRLMLVCLSLWDMQLCAALAPGVMFHCYHRPCGAFG